MRNLRNFQEQLFLQNTSGRYLASQISIHPSNKLQLKICYYGSSHFYLKKMKVYCTQPQICSYMYLVFENITIFQWCEWLNHSAAHTVQKELINFESAVCECSSLRLIQIASELLYRHNKKCHWLFYRCCVPTEKNSLKLFSWLLVNHVNHVVYQTFTNWALFVGFCFVTSSNFF